jgi:hypothetical protein
MENKQKQKVSLSLFKTIIVSGCCAVFRFAGSNAIFSKKEE